MIYLICWLICGVSAFYLLKTYITSNLSRLPSPPENIAQAMRNAAKRDDSIDELYNVPDNVICAAFWTVILVESLCIWLYFCTGNYSINKTFQILGGCEMLTIKRTDHGYYYIQLDGETIHGGLSKESSIVYLKSYQKIWDSGYKFAKDEAE